MICNYTIRTMRGHDLEWAPVSRSGLPSEFDPFLADFWEGRNWGFRGLGVWGLRGSGVWGFLRA